jgi:hypothetical protein
MQYAFTRIKTLMEDIAAVGEELAGVTNPNKHPIFSLKYSIF